MKYQIFKNETKKDRLITVFANDGTRIGVFSTNSKIIISENGNIVRFRYDDKEYVYFNCMVEVQDDILMRDMNNENT